jgi:hypothetical protein
MGKKMHEGWERHLELRRNHPIPYNIINNYFSIGVVSLSRTFQVLFHGKKIHEGWERHLELRRNHPIPYNIINNYFSIGVVSLTRKI